MAVFVENTPTRRSDAIVFISLRARRSIDLPTPRRSGPPHWRGTLCQLALPPSHSLYSAVPPCLPQRLVRLLPMEEILRTMYDGENSGAELTIGYLVLSGVHMLNGDGGHDLVCEEVGESICLGVCNQTAKGIGT